MLFNWTNKQYGLKFLIRRTLSPKRTPRVARNFGNHAPIELVGLRRHDPLRAHEAIEGSAARQHGREASARSRLELI
jgi:hypothetical protein